MSDDGKVVTNLFDKERTYHNCTVQVLTNTLTGEESVGWWENRPKKTRPLEWWVYFGNFNARKIEKYNVFRHAGFYAGCRKAYKNCKGDRNAFLEQVRRELGCCFRSKCEYEVIIGQWPPRNEERKNKVDFYDQVMMNWERFAEYLWENRKELRWKSERHL